MDTIYKVLVNVFFIPGMFVMVQTVFVPNGFADSVRAKAKEGIEHYQKSEFDQAAQSFSQARENQPDDPALTYNLANSQYKCKRFEEALTAYTQSAHSNDGSVKQQSYYNLGNTLFRLGKLEESAQAYKTALKLDPTDMDAKFNLEFVREQIKKQKEQKQSAPQPSGTPSSKDTDRNNDSPSKQDPKDGKGDQKKPNQDQERQAKNKKRESGDKTNSLEPNSPKSKPTDQNQPTDPTPSLARQKRGKMNKEEAERWLGSLVDNPRVFSKSQTQNNEKYPASMGNDW